jgi:epoxide hydrolase-like predicted phosphatase
MKIQAILFDIGGVLVRTIDRAPRQALAERLGMSASDLEALVFGGESGQQAQLGQVDEAEQWAYACRQVNWPVERAVEFRMQFFGGDELDAALLAYIRRLHQAYKTGIISNAMNGTRALIEGSWAMTPLFDAVVLSGEVGVMKPDPRIYQLALARLEVQPGQAVFIDDFQHNIDGARAVGMQGIRFRNPEQLMADLDALLDGSGV